MKNDTCQLCKYYQFQGRREGFCDHFGTMVKGTWQTCPYAQSVFNKDDFCQDCAVFQA